MKPLSKMSVEELYQIAKAIRPESLDKFQHPFPYDKVIHIYCQSTTNSIHIEGVHEYLPVIGDFSVNFSLPVLKALKNLVNYQIKYIGSK